MPKSGLINNCVTPALHDNWKACSSENNKYHNNVTFLFIFCHHNGQTLSVCFTVTYFKMPDSNIELSVSIVH